MSEEDFGLDKNGAVVNAERFIAWLGEQGKSFLRVYGLGKKHGLAERDSELTAERERRVRAEAELASLADTVAAALRNTEMSDQGVELGADLREFIWSLSYKANAYKAELAAAKEDAERLNWMEENKVVEICYWNVPIKYNGVQRSPVEVEWGNRYAGGETLRQALDSARQS